MNEEPEQEERYGGEGQRLWPPFKAKPQPEKESTRTDNEKKPFIEILAIVIAGLAFLAAAWQGLVASDTEERSLRAYVTVKTGEYRYAPGKKLGQQLQLITYGSTPAKNIEVRGIIKITPPDSTSDNLPDAETVTITSGISLFPNENPPPDGWIETEHTLTGEEFSNLSNGSSHTVFAFGIIHYIDVFEKPHFTEFCWWLDPSGIQRDANNYITSLRWANCAHHTGFD